MQQVEDISKSHEKRTVSAHFLLSPQILEKYRTALEEASGTDTKFFEALAAVIPVLETHEIPVEGQKALHGIIHPKEWSKIISTLNDKLADLLKDAETMHSFQLPAEMKAKVALILEFGEKFFQATRGRTHTVFLDSVVHVLKVDDWNLIVKALQVLKHYGKRSLKRSRHHPPLEIKTVSQALLNLALGNNLKSNRKVSPLETLLGPLQDVVLQYFSVAAEAEAAAATGSLAKSTGGATVPSIRTIRLSHLSGNQTPSKVLAEELAKKADLPEQLFPALWSKVRIAKSIASSESDRYNMVLASLLAYIVFCKIYFFLVGFVTITLGSERNYGRGRDKDFPQ